MFALYPSVILRALYLSGVVGVCWSRFQHTHTQFILTLTPRGSFRFQSTQTCFFSFFFFWTKLCEEETHTVLMYREALGSTLELNPSPSCCEATVLSIKPPSHQINVHSLILLRCLIQLPAGERRGRFIGIGGRRRGSTTGSRSGSLPKTGSLAKQVACV